MTLLFSILLIIFFLLGSFLGKYIYFYINKYDFYNIFGKSFEKELKKYLFTPIFNTKLLKAKANEFKEKKKYKSLIELSLISELLGAISCAIFSFFILYSFQIYSGFSAIFFIFIMGVFLVVLLYLAIYDIISFSIPEALVKSLSFAAIVMNVIVVILKSIFFISGSNILKNIPIGEPGNLFAGVIFAILLWIIVKVSKEKAMGEGDIYLVLIIGLLLGWPNTLISFLATLIIGSIVSIILAIYFKKLKGVLVPFVPFLLLGFVVALSFGPQIYMKLFL